MQMGKNKFIIVLTALFLLAFSFSCYANNTISYVWSEISSPIISSSSVLSENER